MKLTQYPTLEECLKLHEVLLKRFGGQGGVRDMGLLDSALARPRSGYYESLSEQAAALLQSLALNHCFVDGNKRVAFALTAIFLRINGWSLIVNAEEGEVFLIVRIIQEKADLGEIAAWLESRMKILSAT
jgi:death on curing protein